MARTLDLQTHNVSFKFGLRRKKNEKETEKGAEGRIDK